MTKQKFRIRPSQSWKAIAIEALAATGELVSDAVTLQLGNFARLEEKIQPVVTGDGYVL